MVYHVQLKFNKEYHFSLALFGSFFERSTSIVTAGYIARSLGAALGLFLRFSRLGLQDVFLVGLCLAFLLLFVLLFD